MINRIISAISAALHTEFGSGYEIYKESVEQGLTEPCFLIRSISPATERVIGNRYYKQMQFLIQYFPGTNNIQEECMEVEERLSYCLDAIRAESAGLNGTDMHAEVIDGVLQFFVTYNLYFYRTGNVCADMETIGVLMELGGDDDG